MVFSAVGVNLMLLLIIFNADIFDSLWLLHFVTRSVSGVYCCVMNYFKTVA